MPFLDKVQMPTVFGVSGYSGAGTRSGEKDVDGRPMTVPKVVSDMRISVCFAQYHIGA